MYYSMYVCMFVFSMFQDRLMVIEEEEQDLHGFEELREDVQATLDTFQDNLLELSDQVQLLIRNVGNEGQGLGRGRANNATKQKIPKAHAHDGVWDAKELENFIVDMDQYF